MADTLRTEPVSPPRSEHDAALLRSWREQAALWLRASLVGERGVVIAGSISAGIYLLLVLAFPLNYWWNRTEDNLGTIPALSNWARPLLALGGARLLNIWMGIIAALVIAGLFSLQGLALYAARTVRDIPQVRRLVVAFAALFATIQLWMQPVTSTDLYGYLARAYLIATLHQNPTISQATLLPEGYLVPHARPPAPYGPLWLAICGVVGRLSGEHLWLAMLLMKLIAVVALLGSIFLVAWLAERLLPGQRVQALLFFSWSPLLIFEAAGNGHNDIVMMVCVLASLAAIVAQRPLLAFPLLAMGVLIKYSVGILIPLWALVLVFLYCWRTDAGALAPLPRTWPALRSWLSNVCDHLNPRRLAVIFGGGGGLAIIIAVAFYAPFWVGIQTFTGLGQQLGATYFNGSIAGMAYSALGFAANGAHASSLGSAIRLLLYAIYGGYVLWQVRVLAIHLAAAPAGSMSETDHTIKRGTILLAQASGKVIFATLVLVTFWYQPWYIVWLIPLAALAPDAILRRQTTTLAFGGMATYIVQYFMFVNQPELTRNFFVQFFLVLVAFAPLLLLQHQSERQELPQAFNQLLLKTSGWVERRPIVATRLMLGLILFVAVLLRTMQLGTSAGPPLLRQLSDSFSLALVDSHAFDGAFAFAQTIAELFFGHTRFAFLLPVALIGSLTVWVIFALADVIFAKIFPDHHEPIALLAALFAATAQWHVALSRSGAHIILLPLLVSLAAWALWSARSHANTLTMHWRTLPALHHWGRHGSLVVLAGCCIGLICDLEPGLSLLLVLIVVIALVLWLQRRDTFFIATIDVALFIASSSIAAIPSLWFSLSQVIGFPPGSPFLARSVPHQIIVHGSFWAREFTAIVAVTKVIFTQNFGDIGPTAATVPILPTLLMPFVALGVILILRRWREPESLSLLALVILPFCFTLAVGVPPSVVIAASVLPIACMLPALGLERVAHWVFIVPHVVAGPENNMFISPQNLRRVALLLLLLITAVSTFFWLFVTVLPGPVHQVNPR